MSVNMNITSAQYKQRDGVNESIDIVLDGQKITVPLDSGNRHYNEIMRQVAAGDLTIQDAD